ncbi:MAG: adenosine-specific kinase [Candidatus Omnitrophota bacterium]
MEIKTVKINKPEDVNVILGQAHFIKTVEDIYEAIVETVGQMKFGLAFCESSGACLVRTEGNDEELRKLAAVNALNVGAGHCFIVCLRQGFPVNVLNAIKDVAEVCNLFAATANPLEVIVAESETGRGILGVIDGAKPKGVEGPDGIKWRKEFLRKIGYKL